MDSSRLFSSSSQILSDRPPIRDGDELIQPLESADLRGFWDNASHGSADPSAHGADSHSDDPKTVTKSLHDLVVKVVDKKAHKGAKAVGQTAQEFCDLYETQDVAARSEFLDLLSRNFCKPRGTASEAARAYLDSTSHSSEPAQSALQAHILRDSLTPLYADLFDQINRLPEGFAFLVHMRTDMLGLIRTGDKSSAIQAMSDFLMRRLQMWIVGTLDLKRITWNSPACTIEKLEQYESVHAVRSWMDIKRRLGNGRRCFGFFHRNAPREPLIFVWVALTDVIPDNVQSILLEREQPKSSEANAKCAIFYSISSQVGLARVDLGNFLIKRVVSVLRTEMPNIETFCTLSPLPRFRSWLDKLLSPENIESPPQDIGINNSEQDNLMSCVPGARTWTEALKNLVDRRGWTADPKVVDAMEPVIRLLGAHYLTKIKRGTGSSAADPVANFHLRNGSCLHRVNWRGDTSYHGLRQSLGLMCNYNYILDRIEDNSESYVADGTIAISGSDPYIARVQSLTKAKL
ncbi:hypothetical protein GGI15_000373 [Coemansia interrupta]|uniref:Malonyl-CoA decarboxylase n=1 Tax=Coemansia interrupta TaxID=1126814 RepID=A0A9W8HKG3_9FUNG|nr:hypothetical protein GGI15_000373 [Coemansia interrupta]